MVTEARDIFGRIIETCYIIGVIEETHIIVRIVETQDIFGIIVWTHDVIGACLHDFKILSFLKSTWPLKLMVGILKISYDYSFDRGALSWEGVLTF